MREVLAAGGGFATTIATILGVAGRYALRDAVIVYGLAAVCLIAAITMLTAAVVTGRRNLLRSET